MVPSARSARARALLCSRLIFPPGDVSGARGSSARTIGSPRSSRRPGAAGRGRASRCARARRAPLSPCRNREVPSDAWRSPGGWRGSRWRGRPRAPAPPAGRPGSRAAGDGRSHGTPRRKRSTAALSFSRLVTYHAAPDAASAAASPRQRIRDAPPELADHGQPLEPGRGIGARRIDLAGRAREARRDLRVELAVLDVVVLVARHEQILVRADVEGANAVARELGGEGLRRDDPRVMRARHELVLDTGVLREDAELPDLAPVQAAPRAGDLDDAREVRREAGGEAQRA